MKANAPNFGRLKGRLLCVCLKDGWHYLRVVRVQVGKRAGLLSITVAASRYEGNDKWSWRGKRTRVRPANAATPIKGVWFRRRDVPIGEFCAAKGGAV